MLHPWQGRLRRRVFRGLGSLVHPRGNTRSKDGILLLLASRCMNGDMSSCVVAGTWAWGQTGSGVLPSGIGDGRRISDYNVGLYADGGEGS